MYLGPEESPRSERRGSKAAVPADVDQLLNQDQRRTLHRLEEFGWHLAFVRRPLFQTPITVVSSPQRERHAVLETDGEVNMSPDIVIRH